MDYPLAFFIWTRWKRSRRTAAGTFVWEPAVLRFWPACFGRGWERGGDLCLYSRDSTVRFHSGVRPVLAWEDGILTVTLNEAAMEELCTVLPFHAGKYPLSAVPLSIVLIPTRITDAEGHVLEVIE